MSRDQKLTAAQRDEIVVRLAAFETPYEIRSWLKREHGITGPCSEGTARSIAIPTWRRLRSLREAVSPQFIDHAKDRTGEIGGGLHQLVCASSFKLVPGPITQSTPRPRIPTACAPEIS